MNCDYCGKDMPESYSYEVGGTVDCGCRFKEDDYDITWHEGEAYIRKVIYDQRIAELEGDLQIAQSEADKYRHDFRNLMHTRVPDELLEWLLSKAHYAGAWGDNYDQVEAILEKRRDNQ